MRHQGKVNPATLPASVLSELRAKGMCQRGLLRYFMRGKDVFVKRI
ncbi:hypothetical protein HY572_06325 [Candidatus Micrarchaeota archaeon]|nr:hypothetical protein [Candidatus Micrarchaeota archaeon]